MRARAGRSERGTIFLAMVFVLVAGVTFILAVYHDASLLRDRAVDVNHDINRSFNLAEIALNESVHQANMLTDGVDNDNDDEIDEPDEGEPSVGTADWDPSTDDLGMDGMSFTGDIGEGDGYPTFGEPNVVPAVSDGGEYYAYRVLWSSDGVDNDQDMEVDESDEACTEFNAFGRQNDVGAGVWIQKVSGAQNLSAWNNAIFAGAGGAGAAIHGNVKVHGSIYIEGTNLADDDPALDFSGTAGQRNDYSGGDATLLSRLPSLPGGTDLGATTRVEQGAVYLSGTGTLGTNALNIDGLYVGDGTYDPVQGNQAEGNVYSDNGATNGMDLPPPGLDMPDLLNDPYTDPSDGTQYNNYKEYYDANSVHINAATVPGWTGVINKATNSFTVGPDAQGNSFSWNKATATITINGRVTFDGDVTLGGTTGPTAVDFTYTGNGALFAQASGGQPGDVTIHGDLLPPAGTIFPTGAFLGVLAEDDIACPASAQKRLCGAFYAADTITSAKQNQIGGAFMANTVDMGSQVPSIYFSLGLADAVPDWFIGAGGTTIAGNDMFRVVRQ